MHLQSDKMHHGQVFMGERKEDRVKKFEIVLNTPPNHRFQPGNEISGAVELEISQPLEICFLEFTVCGYAAACAIHAQQGLSSSKRETYMRKRILILGSPDGLTSTVIIPGRYSSKFTFVLPTNLPSTSVYEDKKGSLSFQVRYFVQARLCDDVVSATLRGLSKRRTIIKVLMSQHRDFIVERPFDIAAIPMAMWPVSRSEDVVLGCGPFDTEKSSLTATLNQSVYCAGDKIFIKLETDVRDAKHFKSLRFELRQRVQLRKTAEVLHFITESVTVKEPTWKIERLESKRPLAFFRVALQTLRNILPSILEGCNLLKVNYSVKISARLVNQAAMMFFEVPLSIAPSKHTILNIDNKEMKVPIFKRPMRFPRFTDSHHATFSHDSSSDSNNHSNRSSQNSDANNSRQQVTVCVHV
ncbi:arrestin domain-containing protein 4-like [Liolophura sinensis]|uniref:arrestin domain-containing protein 4-like n=1 Tax=Liolophura sinensis TaxID=3198878 RepID=UPI0031584B25